MASQETQALIALKAARVAFETHEYEVTADEGTLGESVAASLGVPAERMFKTLVAEVGARPVVAIVPTDKKLVLKALARAVGAKRAAMADAAIAERLTGYVTGGISPFGQKRRLETYVDEAITKFETVFVSAGRRGLQVEVAPADLIAQVIGVLVKGLGS